MTRFICGGWTPNGPCERELAPLEFSCGCTAFGPPRSTPERRRRARIRLAHLARFEDELRLGRPGPCGETLRSDEMCERWCVPWSGLQARGNDCGAIHLEDLPEVRLPARWRIRARRAAEEAAAAERAAAVDWPAIDPPSRQDIDRLLASGPVFAPPAEEDEAERAVAALKRVLGAMSRGWSSWSSGNPKRKGEQACADAWHNHSGLSPGAGQGGVRYAVRDLLRSSIPPRDCDVPSEDHGEVVDFLAVHIDQLQRDLTAVGLSSLRLYRGVHAGAFDDEENPVMQRIRAAIRDGRVRAEGDWALSVQGTFIGSPVASTFDGWTLTRMDAEYWSRGAASGMRCVMAAEVPAWAVVSWGSRGLETAAAAQASQMKCSCSAAKGKSAGM